MPDAGDRARAARIIARVESYGVVVRRIPGHENRGGTFLVVPETVFDHHDASSRKSGEWGALGLITDGTARGIPGPLSNAQVARCLDGIPKIAWVADGTCSHAGVGGPTPSRGLPQNDANRRAYGVEKANDGLGEPYTEAANYATNALFHAMAVESGLADPGSMPFGHKEWTDRKSDPRYSMDDRRRQVGAFVPTGVDMPLTNDDLARIRDIVWTASYNAKGELGSGDGFPHIKDRIIGTDAAVWILVGQVSNLIAEGGDDAAEIAEALRPLLTQAVQEARGSASTATADEVVDKLVERLRA